MLYIDGINLKSIGNILCFISIIIAIIALFNPWYTISMNIDVEDYGTSEMIDIITFDRKITFFNINTQRHKPDTHIAGSTLVVAH